MTEIFIEPELQNLEDAGVAAEWFEVCSKLGLQKQLQHADRSEEKKAPPYMFIDPKTDRIIVTVCPRIVGYKDYSASTIPLDILQEIDKCETNGWYKEIKIAYDDKSPDPFVIGFRKSGTNSWDIDKHLIARWGAELVPFEALEAKAINRIKNAVISQLSEMKYKVDAGLANPELFAMNLLDGKEPPRMSLSVGSTSFGSDLPF